MRLVLDEHLDSAIAAELRGFGHDVVAVTEVADLTGATDQQLFVWATSAGRVVVTYDVSDFTRLAADRQVVGEAAAGLIFVSSTRYPQGRRSYGALIRDLRLALDAHPAPDALNGTSRWLGS